MTLNLCSRRRTLAAAFFVAIGAHLIPASRAGAVVVFDNFGPSNTYQNYGTWFGHHTGLNSWSIDGVRVIPSASGWLDALTLGMFQNSSRNEFILSLRADEDGHPGQTLWTQNYVGLLGEYRSVVNLTDLDGPHLQAGTRYWLIADTPDDVTHHSWYTGMTGVSATARMNPHTNGTWRIYEDVVGWSTRVNVVVPEPGAAGALVLACLMARRRAHG